MKEITSNQNPVYKDLKQLASSAKHRRRQRQTLLEGVHLCQSYLENVGQPLRCVYGRSAANNSEVKAIIAACERSLTSSIMVHDSHYRALSGVENGVDILFVIELPQQASIDIIEDNALLLEGIQDPGNMGTILRTAAAAGVEDVFISSDSASAWSPKVLRAGMGAHFALHIYEDCDLKVLAAQSTAQLLATSLEASQTLYQTDLKKPTAWIFGSEGQGVSKDLLKVSVEKVIIPQNSEVESLNVAAAVAVCLFEQVRQNRSV